MSTNPPDDPSAGHGVPEEISGESAAQVPPPAPPAETPSSPSHEAPVPTPSAAPHVPVPTEGAGAPSSAYGAPPQPGSPYPGTSAYPAVERKGMSDGAKLGLGAGIGCVSYIVAIPLFLALLTLASSITIFGPLAAFLIPLIVGIILAISPRTRRVGIGMLIVSAAAWLVVIGPCVGLLFQG